MTKQATIIVDGSINYRHNGGGWCAIVLEEGKEIARYVGREVTKDTSKMEYIPVIHALAHIPLEYTHITVKSDQDVLSNFYTYKENDWNSFGNKNKPIAFKKYLKFIDRLIQVRESVKFCKVASHSGDYWHDLADTLSRTASIDRQSQYIDSSNYLKD